MKADPVFADQIRKEAYNELFFSFLAASILKLTIGKIQAVAALHIVTKIRCCNLHLYIELTGLNNRTDRIVKPWLATSVLPEVTETYCVYSFTA